MRYYLPFKLRERKEFTKPLGPSFARAKTVKFEMDKEVLKLKLPPHSPFRREFREFPPISTIDLDRVGIYNQNHHLDGWRDGYVLSRSWRFVGPWFTGSAANLHAAVCVSKMAQAGKSLLEPKNFESALVGRINQMYGNETFQGEPSWVPPKVWKVRANFPVPCLVYTVLPIGGGDPVLDCAFPIRPDVLATVRFYQHQLLNGSLEEKDALVSRDSMIELANEIIESIELVPSDNLKAQIDSVRLKDRNAQLNSAPPEFTWPMS